MALDWGKQFSFSGLRKRKPKAKTEYPSKTYMNLAPKDKSAIELRKFVPKALIVIIVAVLFAKFGVLDFYDRVNQKEGELAAQTQTLKSLQEQLVNYDQVKEEYDLYDSARLVSDANLVSAIDALNLVDRYVSKVATVASVDIHDNMISLNLVNISLDEVGKLVSTLYEQPIVANVSVSTAATDRSADRDTTATMLITLQRA